MLNLTFDDVRQFIEQEADGTKLLDAADALLGVALLLAPTMAGLPPSQAEVGIGLLGVKNELTKAGKTLFRKLAKRSDKDAVIRQQRMEAAFALICYTAFFDSLDVLLPELSKMLGLKPSDKLRIAQRATPETQLCPVLPANSPLADFGIPLPHPADTLGQVIARLNPLYQALRNGTLRLLEALEGWDKLPDKKKKEMIEAAQTLPEAAVQRFSAQYYALAAQNPEFYVWASLREHEATRQDAKELSKATKDAIQALSREAESLDLGLKRLQRRIEEVPVAIERHQADAVFGDLEKHYAAAIQEPIIRDPASTDGTATLTYPSKGDIFVPQYFKVLRYSSSEQLEDEATWSKLPVRKDIGEYLLAYLASPYSTEAPLIILGHPGSGKSLFTQILAARLNSAAYAPIRIELRNINADNEIESQIEEQIRKDIGRHILFTTLMDRLSGCPAVLMFDGYDELLQATGQVFANYPTKVQKFQEREHQTLNRNPIRTLITSRITLIDKALIPPNSTVVRLLEFNEDQRQRWIDVWNKANHGYFRDAGVQPFELPSSDPTLLSIAEQPLLLLMLALYDSSSNQLRASEKLDQCALYDSLLRKFIERERLKSPEFQGIPEGAKREAEIELDMERLGAAAIGMFNRHSLNIRSTQLNADLEFFGLGRHVSNASGRALSQAELLLGSFFFVHESKAEHKGEGLRERDIDAAFEFLHNTFGEFLTGQFIVRRVLAETNKLYKLRMDLDQDLQAQRLQTLSDPDGLPARWHSTLMYASLFSRPVILSMLREWFMRALDRSGRRLEDVLDDFDDILANEIRRALSGRSFPSVMVHKATSFDQLPLTGYLANYTLNLVTLRVVLSPAGFEFDEKKFGTADRRPRTWDRLAHLWRAWFSAEVLNPLSAVFQARREGTVIRLTRRDKFSMQTIGKRLDTVLNVGMALGDDIAIALAGLAVHDSFKSQSVALLDVSAAADAEGLELRNSVLLRDLWDAARMRRSESHRRELLNQARAALRAMGSAEAGVALDIVRAVREACDQRAGNRLAWELISRLAREAEAISPELMAGFVTLVYGEDRSIGPRSLDEMVARTVFRSADQKLLARAPDLAFLCVRWFSLHDEAFASTLVNYLNERTRDADFLSSISPAVAARFVKDAVLLRLPAAKALDVSVRAVLLYFLSANQLISMDPVTAATMLELAEMQKYFKEIATVCEEYASMIKETEPVYQDARGLRRGRFDFGNFRNEVVGVLVEMTHKYGSEDAKQVIYHYSVARWSIYGHSRRLFAVVRLARSVDKGKVLLTVLADRFRLPPSAGRNRRPLLSRAFGDARSILFLIL